MESYEVKVYRDCAHVVANIVSLSKSEISFVLVHNCIPESIVLIENGLLAPFVLKQATNSKAELKFTAKPNTPYLISWLTRDITWKASHKVLETKGLKMKSITLFSLDSQNPIPTTFKRISLCNSRLLNQSSNSYPRATMMMRESVFGDRMLGTSENRVFEDIEIKELPPGNIIVSGPIDDFEVNELLLVFQLSRLGEQYPVVHLPIHAKDEIPSGEITVYNNDCSIYGMGNLENVGSNQRAYVELMESRSMKATIEMKKQPTDTTVDGVIFNNVTIAVSFVSPKNIPAKVCLVLPISPLIQELDPKPRIGSLGWIWEMNVPSKGGTFTLKYAETVERN